MEKKLQISCVCQDGLINDDDYHQEHDNVDSQDDLINGDDHQEHDNVDGQDDLINEDDDHQDLLGLPLQWPPEQLNQRCQAMPGFHHHHHRRHNDFHNPFLS